MTFDSTLKMGDVAILIATVLGPVLAVQAQKWVERGRDRNRRRVNIFRTLMTTRASTLSPAHVEALNIVPIEFYGKRREFIEVVNAWKVYIDYLYRDIIDEKAWHEKRIELLNDLLKRMALAIGYKFNSVEISRELYSPKGHVAIQSDQELIRTGLARLLKGEIALAMDIRSFPSDPNFLKNQIKVQEALLGLLGGSESVSIKVVKREVEDVIPAKKRLID